MENKLKSTLEKVHAEDELKEKTAHYLSAHIQNRRPVHRSYRLRFAAVCASFVLLFLIGGFSHHLYFTPAAYVDMDVNPSIELSINRFDRVLDATPYNDDGAVILQDINVRHMPYGKAVSVLLNAMIEQGYLKEDGLVSVTVQMQDRNAENSWLTNLQNAISSSLASHQTNADVEVFSVTEDVRICAGEYGMSPAKYLAIQELQEVDPTATFEGCAGHSINEIREQAGQHGMRHGAPSPEGSPDSPSENHEDNSASPGQHRENGGHHNNGHQ